MENGYYVPQLIMPRYHYAKWNAFGVFAQYAQHHLWATRVRMHVQRIIYKIKQSGDTLEK